jgi:carbon monoxide dehydrogenase subunit G
VDVVWDVATDLEHAPEFIPGISGTEVLTDGGFGVGTRWKETRTMLGRQASEVMTITALEPGRSYTAEASSSGMHYVTRWEFIPVEGGSEIVMSFGGEATGTLAKVMSKAMGFMVGSVQKTMQRDMAELAASAERRTNT